MSTAATRRRREQSPYAKLGAAFGAGLLGLMLLGNPAMAGPDGHQKKQNGTDATATDAAPGGADRETEAGGSGTQGRSDSNPDGEGVDKPYAAAGQGAESQGESDYDGNNGCGNDTDFADDNNGNCGGLKKGHDKPKPGDDEPPAVDDEGDEKDDDGDDDGDVKDTDDSNDGDDTTSPALDDTDDTAAVEGARVMGVQFERTLPAASGVAAGSAAADSAGAQVMGVQVERGAIALARTGVPLLALALVALALIGGGSALRRVNRRA
jgi:hypothetical protein